MSSLKLLLLAIVLLSAFQAISAAEYNEKDGKEYAYAALMSYCSVRSIKGWKCGVACNNLNGYKVHYAKLFIANPAETFSFSMIQNPTTKRFITSFRGSVGGLEMLLQLIQHGAVNYTLTDAPGAQIDEYFYHRYIKVMRKEYHAQLRAAMKLYPDYTYVATGHSLGAALATVAAFDAVASGIIPASQSALFNYGSPRVGNYEFAQLVEKTIPSLFRVTHWKDMIVHIPFCQKDKDGLCSKVAKKSENSAESNDVDDIVAPWPAYHTSGEIFYNDDNSQWKTCEGGEDLNCSAQWKFKETSFGEHKKYYGIKLDCNPFFMFERDYLSEEKLLLETTRIDKALLEF